MLNYIFGLFLFVVPQQDTIKTHSLEEVVIIASRGDSNSPISEVTLKTTDLPINYNGQELPSILATTPSITWYSDGGHYTGYAYYRLRGIDQTRINVTLNGIPLNEPEDQGAYFSNYPDFINSIKSIQIQRGVGLSSNGTASFAGSINLQSPSLLDSTYSHVEQTVGSFNTSRFAMEYNSGLLNKFAIYTRASTVSTSGFRNNSGTAGTSAFMSMGYFEKKSMFKFTGFIGTSKNDMAYLAASKSDLENNYKTNYLRDDEKDRFVQSLLSLEYTLNINDKQYLTTTVYYNHLNGNYDVYADPDMLNFQLKSNWIGAFTNYHYEGDKTKIIAGLHANTYNRNHEMAIQPSINLPLYSNTGFKKEGSAFIRVTQEISRLILSGDLQARTINFVYKPDNASSDLSFNSKNWNFINPKFGITYKTNDKHNLYASIGLTHREPTRNDLFAGYDDIDHSNYAEVGNFNNVKPEQVIDLEVGQNINTSILSLDANVYYMKFKNEIAAIGQLSYIGLPLRKNVESSYRMGFELSGTVKATKNLLFKTSTNLSKNRIKEYTTDFDGVTYHDVNPLLTPSFILNEFVVYSYKKFSFNLNGRYSSSSFLDNTNNKDFTVPSSFIVNSSVGYRFWKIMQASVDVNNIFNKKYYYSGYVSNNESNYFAMATRNIFVTLGVTF